MKKFAHRIASSFHKLVTGVHPPAGFLSAGATLLLLLLIGTAIYSYTEGWSLFNSFYFTVITISTVGYGDMYPTHIGSKLFTIFLIFMGVGLGLYVISTFSDSLRKGRETRMNKLEKRIKKLLNN